MKPGQVPMPIQIQIDPAVIYYSQTSVTLKKEHQQIAKELLAKGWDNKYSLDVVAFEKNFVSLDNRRLLLAHAADVPQIKCSVHQSDEADEKLKQMFQRFSAQMDDDVLKGRRTKANGFQMKQTISQFTTWGQFIQFRMSQQEKGKTQKGTDGFSEIELSQIYGKTNMNKTIKKTGLLNFNNLAVKWKPPPPDAELLLGIDFDEFN